MADREARVSQGGEGRIRRVTPADQRQMAVAALVAGRSDVATQAGWNLALDVARAKVRDAICSYEGNWDERELADRAVAALDALNPLAGPSTPKEG